MSDDRFEDFLRRVAPDYHRPPETPREQMWARIAAARAERPAARRLAAGRLRLRWVVAAAAAVAAGVGLASGFWPRARPDQPMEPGPVVAEHPMRGPLEVAAADHFRRVETFLTVFEREGDPRASGDRTGKLARDLLANTRLLMDSPAGRDPGLAALLEDIEVVLAQIASYPGGRDRNELRLIDEGIEGRSLLLKLRAARATKYGVAIVQGVL
jgi:hypothetical protein